MPVTSSRAAAIAAVATFATLASAAGPAAAAGHHTAARHGAHSHAPHAHPAVPVAVHGLVVHRSGNRLVVLAHDVTAGKRTRHNLIETLVLPAPHHRRGTRALASLATTGPQAGDVITALGRTVDGSTVSVSAVQAVAPSPARALLGVVASVNGSLVTLTPGAGADGEHDGADGQDAVTVDTAAATFTGTAGTASALTAGQYVVVLGEESDGDFAAAQVFSYAAEPQVAVGRVVVADPAAHTLTVVADHGDEENGDVVATGTAVDATTADVVVNGNDGQQGAAFPAVGDTTLVVGTDGSAAQPATPLAATVVFAFNHGDDHPVGDNED